MIHGRLPFSYRRASVIGSGMAFAIVLVANIEQARAINPTNDALSGGAPTSLLRQVADSGSHGGPGGFADLAEKVEPAVIAVSSQAVTPNALPRSTVRVGQARRGTAAKREFRAGCP